MSNVIEINDIERLDDYRLVWRSLLDETRDAMFFQSLEWLQVYWRHFGEGQKLRVLIVCSAGQPIGILPLVVTTESTKVGRLRTLTYPLAAWGSFYGPIGRNARATLQAAMQHIRATDRDWDVIDLRWVNQEEVDYSRTERSMRAAGFQAHRVAMSQVGMVDLSDGWAAFWKSRKSHWRTNVRRSQRKLAERGKVTYERYRPLGTAHGDDDPRWDLYDACEQIAARSWQHDSSTGSTISNSQVREFLRDVHVAAVKAGAVDVNVLKVDGVAIAFAYNYHYQGRVFGLRMGFDAELARDGAGTVLMRTMLEESCQRDDHTYDMGAGYLEFKRQWLTHTVTPYRYAHYPNMVLRSQVIRAKRWIERAASARKDRKTAKIA